MWREKGDSYVVRILTVSLVWKIKPHSPETMKRVLKYSKCGMLYNIKVISHDWLPGYTICYRLPDVRYIE